MNDPLPPPQVLLNHAISWQIAGNNAFLVTVIHNTHSAVLTVPDEYLKDAHTVLPALLRTLIQYKESNKMIGAVSGAIVLAQMAVLQGHIFSFTDSGGRRQLFSTISDLTLMGRYASVSGNLLITVQSNMYHDTVPMVLERSYSSQVIPVSVLNSIYPGWDKRYTLGKELGIPKDELLLAVFPKFNGYHALCTATTDAHGELPFDLG